MKHFLQIAIMILSVSVLFCGCGKEEKKAAKEETAMEEPAEETFTFVDVNGQEFEAVLDPEVEKTRYDRDLFYRKKKKMRYGDESVKVLHGIDVSHYQGSIDWNAVKKDGIDFAFLRIGYRGYGKDGTLNEDPKFEEYYQGASKAGLSVGVYFFAQAVNVKEAKEEADFVLDILDGRTLDFPVVYDPESIKDDEARTDDVSGKQFTKNTAAFCQRIEDGGYEPLLYTNVVWEAFMLDLKQLSDWDIWIADYEKKPQTPYHYTCWQYTESGSVSGIEGSCDLDIWLENK